MKNTRKGFASFVLLIIVAVVAVGGGAYYYSHKNTVKNENTEKLDVISDESIKTSTSTTTSTVQTSADVKLNLVEQAVRQEIQKEKLSYKIECLSFTEISEGEWQIREKHNAQCGGDVQIAPRLFNVRVNGEAEATIYARSEDYLNLIKQ
ncbi:MAG: hypothetical protein K0S38_656 [Candidatus Paceibacter sp.]|jgi:hypothetical protein|nr:hypothetical protein [Candidatus Paceibacter sp.]